MKFIKGKTRIEYGGAMLGFEEVKAVMDVMLSQGGRRWTVGPESIAFEKELAEVTGVSRAVVVNSGSSALLIALAALKLKKGAKVGIPALNFPTAFNAIIQNGYTPVVFDCDPKTLNISLNEIDIYTRTQTLDAVIAVNIASNPVNVPKLRQIVGYGTKIITDNCDGYGTIGPDGLFIDTKADISCVSFHAAHIITTGEGGAVLTNNEELADRVLKMREWGRASGTDNIYSYEGFPNDYRERYVYEEIGYNMKPLELQCAMGRVQLKKLDHFREIRMRNFTLINDQIKQMKKFDTISTDWEGSKVCYFSYPFMCRGVDRKTVMETLEKNNIECRTIFSGNILLHPAYKDVECEKPFDPYPNATDVMNNGVFISVHPSITPEMINFIGEVLRAI